MAEPSYLAAVRESYDTVAAAYAERVPRPHAFGIDVSPEMTSLARAARPGLRIETGSMTGLQQACLLARKPEQAAGDGSH